VTGLHFLIILGMGAVGGWCAYALIRGGETTNRLPDEVRRKMDRWDGTR
jgi:tRNA A37 threonylcarbamoyladenosine dehydratase